MNDVGARIMARIARNLITKASSLYFLGDGYER